ncbi:MAG: TetR/AcrR family transcriptional regulator [SAR202 cluster bacterium]|nr:TetR/AcrR family transcriptional regulator [SAR202 cluster bacterium]
MPKVTEAHMEARKQQIMAAAMACFSRQGFHQTSIHDICKEAELSPGAVYRYFPSKEHIIAASCLDCQQGIIELIEYAKSQGNSPFQALDFIIEHGLSMLNGEGFREHSMMNVQVWSEAVRSEEIRDALFSSTFNTIGQTFADLFAEAQKRGEVNPKLDPQALGITVMGMFHGLVLHKTLDSKIDVAACGDAMRALYHGTFRTTVDQG